MFTLSLEGLRPSLPRRMSANARKLKRRDLSLMRFSCGLLPITGSEWPLDRPLPDRICDFIH
jgi:hypothetical protein